MDWSAKIVEGCIVVMIVTGALMTVIGAAVLIAGLWKGREG